jgi:hypothetical protein
MSYTLYDGTIPVVRGILNTLSHILQLASLHPNASTLLAARLHPDMYPLADQVRLVTQFAENLAARLSGRAVVPLPGNPTSFPECQQRMQTVLHTLTEVDRDAVNAHGDVLGPTPMGPETSVEMSAATYAHRVALPNIYFHLTTAYGILRKEGVQLGKRDYYAGFFPPQ